MSKSISFTLFALVSCSAFAFADDVKSPKPADVVILKSGRRIEGEVVKRSDRRVWLDVGPDVLVFEMTDVGEVQNAEGVSQIKRTEDSLFSTAENLPELSPREHAKIIGAAVIKVSTPAGLGSGVIISQRLCDHERTCCAGRNKFAHDYLAAAVGWNAQANGDRRCGTDRSQQSDRSRIDQDQASRGQAFQFRPSHHARWIGNWTASLRNRQSSWT